MAGISSTIDTLKSAIEKGKGLARSNRFEVIFSLPPALFELGNVTDNAQKISLLAQSCSLPGRTIDTISRKNVRQSVKVPSGYSQEDITMTFLLTNDYFAKRLIDRWVNSSVDQETYRVSYDNYYCSDILINQIDTEDKKVYSVKLLRAWPVSYESITLSHENENDVVKLSVTFTYDDFEFDPNMSV